VTPKEQLIKTHTRLNWGPSKNDPRRRKWRKMKKKEKQKGKAFNHPFGKWWKRAKSKEGKGMTHHATKDVQFVTKQCLEITSHFDAGVGRQA
jgi:hypothetical protein